MLRLFALGILTIVFGLGCAKKALRERAQVPVVPHLNDSLVLAVNGAQADLKAAIDQAFPGKTKLLDFSTISDLGRTKVEDMRKALADDGLCQFNGVRPTPEAMGEYEVVDSAKEICPIELWERWTFDQVKGLWEINRTFKVVGKEFYNLADLHSYKINGAFTFTVKEGMHEVVGKINFDQVTFNQLGPTSISISTKQKIKGRDGGGSISAVVSIGGKAASGVIIWTENPEVRNYSVNGELVDKKYFADRFSAYGLDEIIDSTRKLR